jgi:hypothetical protein
MPSRLLNLLSEVVVRIQIENVCHQVQRILVILDLRIQTCQVESIRKIFLINLAEIFISSRRYKLEDKRRCISQVVIHKTKDINQMTPPFRVR